MMTGPCFYCPDLPAEGVSAELSEAETRHACAARRVRPGDSVGLIDGHGTRASAVVRSIDRRGLTVLVGERRRLPPPSPTIIIASAVPKGERFRAMIDMLAQLGVSAIVPLHCERSEVKPKTSSVDRWRRIAIEACKQSRNPFIPQINDPVAVPDSLARVKQQDTVVFADPGGGSLEAPASGGSLFIYIGPEGGFSAAEKRLLAARGGLPLGLGDNILRVETAALAALALGRLAACGKQDRTAP